MNRTVFLFLRLIFLVFASILVNHCTYGKPTILSLTPMRSFESAAGSLGDGSDACLVGSENILWMSGDTATAAGFLSSTAAWSTISEPWKLTEESQRLPNGQIAPLQFIPYTTSESNFNTAHNDTNIAACCKSTSNCSDSNKYCNCPIATDCKQRYAHWPLSSYAVNSTTAFIYYHTIIIGWYGWDYTHVGFGGAYVTFNKTVATRVLDASLTPKYIFTTSGVEPLGRSVEVGDFYYFYTVSTAIFCGVDVYVSRVNRSTPLEEASFEFYSVGGVWKKSRSSIVSIASVDQELGSVAYVAAIGSYLSFTVGFCAGAPKGNFRTASTPEGKWSDVSTFDMSVAGATSGSYQGVLHPMLAYNNTILISFFTPGSLPFSGSVRLYNLTLGPNNGGLPLAPIPNAYILLLYVVCLCWQW